MTRGKFGTHCQLEEYSELQSDICDFVWYRMLRRPLARDSSETTLSALSAQQADNADSSEKVSSQNESELDATSALQGEDGDSLQTSPQNHSPLLSEAAVADEGSTRCSRDCSQNEEAMLQIPVASVLNEWIFIEWTDATSSSILSNLPTDESVFYEWWDAEPPLSLEQRTLSWLGLTGGSEDDEICTPSSPQVPSNSSDSLDSLDTPSPLSFPEIDWDDQISAPSSPQSVLEFDQDSCPWATFSDVDSDFTHS